MRLNRYLATCGIASRRSAEAMIVGGRVLINGKKITDLATTVSPERDVVLVDGKKVEPIRKMVYVLLYKPKGYITTANDELGRKNVLELVKLKERIFPIGRLDRNSEGLLLLTNDGDMAFRLMHPRFKVDKTYRVRLETPFREQDFEAFSNGIELEDGITSPCKAGYLSDSPNLIEIRLHEGRNHQVRRMLNALGYEVAALKRVQYGPLTLKGLARSEWRMLTQFEVMQLRKAVGLVKTEERQRKRGPQKNHHRD
ncbi:MAG: rRNA pseudouridine synthase [Calditrichaeota bacterium]|nr:MAG: rRNA pseudouridine synthase [Calditrichota bacterium]